LYNILFNDQWVIEKIMEEIKIFTELNENENAIYQKIVGYNKGNSKIDVYRHE
jgi:hypothetical protein